MFIGIAYWLPGLALLASARRFFTLRCVSSNYMTLLEQAAVFLRYISILIHTQFAGWQPIFVSEFRSPSDVLAGRSL